MRAFAADGFGHVNSMFAGFARQNGGLPKSIDNSGNAAQRCVGIALRPLQVTRELRAQMADHFQGKRAGQRRAGVFGLDVLDAVV